MHRFFVSKDQTLPTGRQVPNLTGSPRTISVRGSDVHHIKDVLRMKAGDVLELLDGTGKIYSAKISEIKKDQIVCKILSIRAEESELKAKVTLAQCLPKAKKMDLIIQKCTELGAHKIIPALSERSIPKGEKLVRWRKIAKESAEQCGRSSIPEISPLATFEDVLKLKPEYDLAIIPWELEKEKTLKSALKGLLRGNCMLILIGPEGGFSRKEIELAETAGFLPVNLGPRILRTETVGMAILSMINYELL